MKVEQEESDGILTVRLKSAVTSRSVGKDEGCARSNSLAGLIERRALKADLNVVEFA